MHSSRMRTSRSSSHLLGGVCLSECWDTHPPPGYEPGCPPPRCGLRGSSGVGLETPLGVGLETPLGVVLDSPGQTRQLPPWVWAWRPPRQTPQLSPWVWAWRPAMHAGIPPHPVNIIRDTCKNITLPQLRCER